MDLKYLDARLVKPPHAPRYRGLLRALVTSMSRRGWAGRPLIVIRFKKGDYQALTGSHRIAAARKVGLTLPCYFITWKDLGPRCQELYRRGLFDALYRSYRGPFHRTLRVDAMEYFLWARDERD